MNRERAATLLRTRPSRVYVDAMTTQAGDGCTRCGDARHLRSWRELSDAEREVVRRLPASARFSFEERAARHVWCVRCWHEATSDARREV